MTTLTEYKRNGFHFKIHKRAGDFAVFKGTNKLGGESIELIRIQHNPPSERFGKSFPASETPPRSEDWGCKGWTYGAGRLSDAILGMECRNDAATRQSADR